MDISSKTESQERKINDKIRQSVEKASSEEASNTSSWLHGMKEELSKTLSMETMTESFGFASSRELTKKSLLTNILFIS